MRKVIVGEWMLVMRGPARGRPGPVAVAIEGVDPKDVSMARALAMVAAVWFNAARRES